MDLFTNMFPSFTTHEPIINEHELAFVPYQHLNPIPHSVQPVVPAPRRRGRPRKFPSSTPKPTGAVKNKRTSPKPMAKLSGSRKPRRTRSKSREDSPLSSVASVPGPETQAPSEFWKEMTSHSDENEALTENQDRDEDDEEGDSHEDGIVAAQLLREAAATVSRNMSIEQEEVLENAENSEHQEHVEPELIQTKTRRGLPKGGWKKNQASSTQKDGANNNRDETDVVPKTTNSAPKTGRPTRTSAKSGTPAPDTNEPGRTRRVAGQRSAEKTSKAYALALDPVLDSASEGASNPATEPVKKDGRGRKKGFTKAMFKANSNAGGVELNERSSPEAMSADPDSEVQESSPPLSARRGRPSKSHTKPRAGSTAEGSDPRPMDIETSITQKRRHPFRNHAEPDGEGEIEDLEQSVTPKESAPRKRGRPSKAPAPAVEPKKRGRPAKSPAARGIVISEASKTRGRRTKNDIGIPTGSENNFSDITKFNTTNWNIRGFTITMRKVKAHSDEGEKALLEGEFELAPADEENSRDVFDSKMEVHEGSQVVKMKFRGELL
jgi:hypothetical protein